MKGVIPSKTILCPCLDIIVLAGEDSSRFYWPASVLFGVHGQTRMPVGGLEANVEWWHSVIRVFSIESLLVFVDGINKGIYLHGVSTMLWMLMWTVLLSRTLILLDICWNTFPMKVLIRGILTTRYTLVVTCYWFVNWQCLGFSLFSAMVRFEGSVYMD